MNKFQKNKAQSFLRDSVTNEFLTKNCHEEQACKLLKTKPPQARITWPYPNSWTEEYSYYCEFAYLRSYGKTVILAMNTTICLTFLILADFWGRRKVLLFSSINVLIGLIICVIIPNLFVKMLGIGLSAGSEGVFSALFTMMINESTLISTKMRSTLISGCFLAYGLGCLFINIVTYWIRGADALAIFALFIVFFAIVPAFFSYAESPKFLQKKGMVSAMISSLAYIARVNRTAVFEKDLYLGLVEDEANFDVLYGKAVRVDVGFARNHPANRWKIRELFCNPM